MILSQHNTSHMPSKGATIPCLVIDVVFVVLSLLCCMIHAIARVPIYLVLLTTRGYKDTAVERINILLFNDLPYNAKPMSEANAIYCVKTLLSVIDGYVCMFTTKFLFVCLSSGLPVCLFLNSKKKLPIILCVY